MTTLAASTPKTFIIGLGGSMVVPDNINVDYLHRFRSVLQTFIPLGVKFIVVIGGGKVSRRYISALKDFCGDQESLDWMGVYATRLNAQFVRLALQDLDVDTKIITDPTTISSNSATITVAGGWKPGWSTDYVAVKAAEAVNANAMVSLTNVEYVYDKDPRKFAGARKFTDLSWSHYETLIPKDWRPGMSAPFDPVATQKAKEMQLKVALIHGEDLESLANFLHNEKFKGTLLHA